MNKKGYTLVELIAVIAIIAILATILIMNFDGVINKNKQKSDNFFKEEVEKAACVYIDLKSHKTIKDACYPSKNCSITANDLITDGLISDELKDPVTGNKINKNLVINITWDLEGTKTCTLTR